MPHHYSENFSRPVDYIYSGSLLSSFPATPATFDIIYDILLLLFLFQHARRHDFRHICDFRFDCFAHFHLYTLLCSCFRYRLSIIVYLLPLRIWYFLYSWPTSFSTAPYRAYYVFLPGPSSLSLLMGQYRKPRQPPHACTAAAAIVIVSMRTGAPTLCFDIDA